MSKDKEESLKEEGNSTEEDAKPVDSEAADIEEAESKSDMGETEKETAEPEEKTAGELKSEYEEKLKEREDRYLRLAAEFDNYKKRNARMYENMVQLSREGIIVPILDLVDNFERALDAAEKNSDFDSLKEGTRLIYQQVSDLLKKEGVEAIEAVGQKFDPNLHEAMMQVDSVEYPEGIIAQEMVRGYKMNGKVIRHSKVVVSRGQPAPESDSESESDTSENNDK